MSVLPLLWYWRPVVWRIIAGVRTWYRVRGRVGGGVTECRLVPGQKLFVVYVAARNSKAERE